MTSNEIALVMRQWLEALENSVDLVSEEARQAEALYGNYPSRLGKVQGLVALEVAHEKAIKSLRAAIASNSQAIDAAKQLTRAEGTLEAEKNHIEDNLTMVQEPVAWVVYSSAENDIVWADKGKRLKQNTPLYTSPPKRPATPLREWVESREWRGLTDEEYQPLRNGLIKEGKPLHWFAEQLEAKLKEKNFS